MADVAMWQDRKVRAEFDARAKARLHELQNELAGKTGVVGIEPETGDYFVGATLGKANDAAFAEYPDAWIYFVRLDNPEAAITLPSW
jgi:hypothetical protein